MPNTKPTTNNIVDSIQTLAKELETSLTKQKIAQLEDLLKVRVQIKDPQTIDDSLFNKLRTLIMKFEPSSRKELHLQLSTMGLLLRDKTREQTLTKNGENKIKYKPLDLETIVLALPAFLHFIRLGDHESQNLPLFMYDIDQGLYTRNEDIIDLALLQFQPGLNTKNSEEVRRQIRLQSPIRAEHQDNFTANVKNGMFNILTKTITPYTPDIINIRKIETNYNPTAQHPIFPNNWTFESWLNTQFKRDLERKFMWQLIQFLPMVSRPKNVFVLMFDQLGNTGKGMFQDILQNLTGFANTGNSTMVELNSRFGLAPVFDKTLIISGENDATYMADNGNLKNVATGDMISVEPKGKDAFTARCTALMVFASNSIPRFGKMDAGVKRRVRVQEFTHSYSGKVDHNIRDLYIKDQEFLEYLLKTALHMPFEPEIVDPESSKNLKKEIEVTSNFAYDYVVNRLSTYEGGRIPYNVLFADAEAYATSTGRKFGYEQTGFVREVVAELRKAGYSINTKTLRFSKGYTKMDYDWFYNFRLSVPNGQIGIWLSYDQMKERFKSSQRGIEFIKRPQVSQNTEEIQV